MKNIIPVIGINILIVTLIACYIYTLSVIYVVIHLLETIKNFTSIRVLLIIIGKKTLSILVFNISLTDFKNNA